jgi:hypothetical protein
MQLSQHSHRILRPGGSSHSDLSDNNAAPRVRDVWSKKLHLVRIVVVGFCPGRIFCRDHGVYGQGELW